MGVPVSLINDLQSVPRDTPAALLLRHAARHPISDPLDHTVAELTEAGVRSAEELGARIQGQFAPGRLLSSPVSRCRATAEALARGAGWDTAVVQVDERLTHEFMAPAWFLVQRMRVLNPLPFQVSAVLRLMLPLKEEQPVSFPPEEAGKNPLPTLDVLVTHDTVLGGTVSGLLGAPVLGAHWPGYLEGMLMWRAGGRIFARWRGEAFTFSESFERIE